AAYGYHSDNPVPITEDVPPRGSPEHYYSQQKAACEAALSEVAGGSSLEVYVLRPCIVAGPKAPALAEAMPWSQLPGPVKRVVPSALEWLHVGRASVVMDTAKAKSRLGWTPKYTAAETLSALGAAT